MGLGIAYIVQVNGLNIAGFLQESSMMIPDVIRTQISGTTGIIGFLPGLLATFLGTAMSGIGIYKRQTSELFKELET
jgi:putative ABC transport system permease protein